MSIKETIKQMAKQGYSIDEIYDAIDDVADEISAEEEAEKAKKVQRKAITDKVHSAAALLREAALLEVDKKNADMVNEFFNDEVMEGVYDVAIGIINNDAEDFSLSLFSDLFKPGHSPIKVKKCKCKDKPKTAIDDIVDLNSIISNHLKNLLS